MTWSKKKKRVILLILTIIIVVLGTFFWWPDHQWSRTYPTTEGNTCTIFLIDGLSSDIFKEELQAGHLPVMKKMIDEGIFTENGISSFPTMTGYGFYPFITGVDATESGILGLRWFDRKRTEGNLRNYVGRTNIHMNDDMSNSVKNIFELSSPYYTASINTFMDKGVQHNIKTGWSHTTAKYEGKSIFKWLRMIPFFGKSWAKNHFEHETEALQLAIRQLRKNPKVQWITFPSPDAYNHVSGTDHTYRKLIHHIDSLIGVYISAVKQLGQDNQRMIAVVSDHGISDVNINIDFCGWMKDSFGLEIERGKSVHIFNSSLDQPLEDIESKDGFFVINGNLTAYLYMKNPDQSFPQNWGNPLPYPLLTRYPSKGKYIHIPEVLSQNENLELIVYKDDQENVTIRNGKHLAQLSYYEQGIKYDTTEGNPLFYPDSLIGKIMSESDWLIKTTETEFPYAVPRIWKLMNAPGIGDIVMTSRKGVDLANDYEIFVGNYKGGHGGLRKEIITVPYMIKMPDGQTKKIQALRNEDIGKMVKKHLGF